MTLDLIDGARSWALSSSYHELSTLAGIAVLALLVVCLAGREMVGADASGQRIRQVSRVLDMLTIPLLIAFCVIMALHFATDILGWRP